MSSAGQSRILAGRYRLEEVIGRGGMSTVYRGTDLSLDRTVAVKVALDPLAEENPVYVARFKREARAAAALNHPGVVTIFDAGADGSTRYIVMECVEGRSLSELLRDEGRLDPGRAARIAEQIADTLVAAHSAGIVHRDIKPGNVMVDAEDRVKVLDFGIARTADAAALTQTAAILGTAPYMAPEQAMGQPADARSDIYSLGCVLYEMLTGEPPFMADLPAAVMHQHVRVAPRPPSEHTAAVPSALDALVLEMLAKNPDDRPQTAAQVRDRLAALDGAPPTAPTAPIAPVEVLAAAAEVPQPATVAQPATPAATPPQPATSATRPLAPAPAATARPPTARPPTGRPPTARRRGPGLYVALAAIAVVLLGAAVAYAIAGGAGSRSSSTRSRSASHAAPPATSQPASTPHTSSHPSSSSTSASTSTPASSTSTTTKTVTSTATGSSSSSTPTSTPTTTVPPGQGGTPPGQAKKKKG